ncbi:MAG: S41 family peptidase, partial [Pirellulaceae bacterium]
MKLRITAIAAWLGVCSLILTAQTAQTVSAQENNLVANGTFEDWADEVPVDWDVGIGANNGGDAPVSEIRQGEGPSLELSGDAATLAWRSVSQDVPVTAGTSYRLSYVVKTADVRREGNQYDNCFVGVFQKDARGELLSRDFWPSNIAEFTPASAVFRVAPGATTAQVLIFLSKSGTLNVKDISLVELGDADSFDILVKDMNRHYSYFELKGIDWPALTEKYRERAEAADNNDEFIDVVTDMLAELEDIHTWVMKDGQRISKYVSSYDGNFDFRVVDQDLEDAQRIGRFGVVGKTADGTGYVRIQSLSGIDQRSLSSMVEAIEDLFDAPGIIVDLRRNGGGA